MTFDNWFTALYVKRGFVSSKDELREAWEEATQSAIPPGWKLVPAEPTPEMLRAGFLTGADGFDVDQPADAPGLVYRAMIAAVPALSANTGAQQPPLPGA